MSTLNNAKFKCNIQLLNCFTYFSEYFVKLQLRYGALGNGEFQNWSLAITYETKHSAHNKYTVRANDSLKYRPRLTSSRHNIILMPDD